MEEEAGIVMVDTTTLFMAGIPTIGFIFYALLETGKIANLSSIPIFGRMFPEAKPNVYFTVDKASKMITPDGEYRISRVMQSPNEQNFFKIWAMNKYGEKHTFNVSSSNLFPKLNSKNDALSMTNPSEAIDWYCNINRNGHETNDFGDIEWDKYNEMMNEKSIALMSRDEAWRKAQSLVISGKAERKEIEKGELIGMIRDSLFGRREVREVPTVITPERRDEEKMKEDESNE